MLIYLARGSLPWQGVKLADKKLKYEKIKETKLEWDIQSLCEETNLPLEFVEYFEMVRAIEFEQKPDYSGLRGLFKNLLYKMGYEFDYMFDWV